MIHVAIPRPHPQYFENFMSPNPWYRGHLVTRWARNRPKAEWIVRKCNLLYCNNCEFPNLIFAKSKPRVGDIESLSYFTERKKDIASRVLRMKKVLFNTKWAMNDIIKTVGENDKFVFLPQGVRDYEIKAREDDTFKVLFIGTDFYKKGGDLVASAFKELNMDDSKLTVKTNTLLAGTKHEWMLKDKRIEVINAQLPYSNIHKFFETHDVFAMPSRWESYGFVFLEAMSHSRPIITSTIPPMPEVVGDGGLYAGNVEELTNHLGRLADDVEYRENIAKKGKKLALTKYSLANFQREFKKVCEEATGICLPDDEEEKTDGFG